MLESDFVRKVRSAGGRAFIVGGWVRDYLRGAKPKDKDYVLTGLDEQDVKNLFPKIKKIGKSFPVFQLEIDGEAAEIALARTEKKCGSGYHGFTVDFNKDITIEEDLYRRDTTINSMAMELPDMKLLDPYDGQVSLAKKEIKAVSVYFCDDPVRALRAARQAAEFGFTVTEDTLSLMGKCREELQQEPGERLFLELSKALQTARPSVFFEQLRKAGLLAAAYPEIFALLGKTQPAIYHPEGDAYNHTLQIVDLVAANSDNPLVRFAGLVHDLGKGVTPQEMLPHHYGHEVKGIDVLQGWNRRMTLPKKWLQGGLFAIGEHMRAPRLSKAKKIVRLILAMGKNPLGIEGFKQVVKADNKSLPFYLEYAGEIHEALQQVSVKDCPEGLQGAAIGEWLFSRKVQVYLSFVKEHNLT